MKTAKNKLVVISPVQVNGALPVHLAVFSSVPLRGHTIPFHQFLSCTTFSNYFDLKGLTVLVVTAIRKPHLIM